MNDETTNGWLEFWCPHYKDSVAVWNIISAVKQKHVDINYELININQFFILPNLST